MVKYKIWLSVGNIPKNHWVVISSLIFGSSRPLGLVIHHLHHVYLLHPPIFWLSTPWKDYSQCQDHYCKIPAIWIQNFQRLYSWINFFNKNRAYSKRNFWHKGASHIKVVSSFLTIHATSSLGCNLDWESTSRKILSL